MYVDKWPNAKTASAGIWTSPRSVWDRPNMSCKKAVVCGRSGVVTASAGRCCDA